MKTEAEQKALEEVVKRLIDAVQETIKKSGFIFWRREDESRKT